MKAAALHIICAACQRDDYATDRIHAYLSGWAQVGEGEAWFCPDCEHHGIPLPLMYADDGTAEIRTGDRVRLGRGSEWIVTGVLTDDPHRTPIVTLIRPDGYNGYSVAGARIGSLTLIEREGVAP